MNQTTLEKIISDTQSSPYIKWNDETLADLMLNSVILPGSALFLHVGFQ